MYLHPEGGGKRRGPMPLGLFLFLLDLALLREFVQGSTGFFTKLQRAVIQFPVRSGFKDPHEKAPARGGKACLFK